MSETSAPDGQRGLDRLRRYTWWFLVPYPLFAATVGVLQEIGKPHSSAVLVAILASFVLVTVVSVRSFDAVTRGPDPTGIGVLDWLGFAVATVALAVTALLAAPFEQRPFGWWLLGGALAGALLLRLPPVWRLPGLAVMAIGSAAIAALATGYSVTSAAVWGTPGFIVSIAGVIWVQWWSFDVARQLEQARLVTAELAVARERLRFAAELHDIQGHHLQVIALKSELAARVAEQRPQSAVALMGEVQGLARDALRDTRAVVGGYRRVSVRTEISNAVRVLTAAGIRTAARLPDTDPRWSAEVERELGLLVREATTNVLRHAKPGRAEVELTVTDDAVALRLGNDGAESGPGTASSGPEPGGTGLAGLRDRFTAAGGSLDWNRDGDEFTVSAILPLSTDESEGVEQR